MGSELTDSSPALCHPLHNVLHSADPYVSPYYQQYAEPYVKAARPYAEKVHHVFESKISTPIVDKTTTIYLTHAHPFFLAQAEKVKGLTQPIAEKTHDAYSLHVQPLVEITSDYCNRYVSPVYGKVSPYFTKLQQQVVVPVYSTCKLYTSSFVPFCKVHILPTVNLCTKKTADFLGHYSKWTWSALSPKLSAVYENSVEPQVNKIIDRIFQASESSISTVPPAIIDSSAPSHTLTSESTASTPSSTSSTSSESFTSEVKQRKPKHSSNEFNQEERADARLDRKRARKRANSITSELSNWKRIVNRTTKDAFETFKADISQEKERLVVGSRPKFTRRLQKLQKLQQSGFTELQQLIADMEAAAALYDDPDMEIDDIDFPWTPEIVQATFKGHAEKVRKAAMDVREYSQTFAQEALNRTEDIRSATIDVLDEFSDVALQEIGRKMVSDPSDPETKVSGGDNKAKWSDWKEFRMLKEHLIQTRQDLVDFDIPMEDINIVLRQAQETANILAKEAAQYLSQLKAKADTLLILKIKKEEERMAAQGKELPNENYEDIIFYEDIEGEVPVDESGQVEQKILKKEEVLEEAHDEDEEEVEGDDEEEEDDDEEEEDGDGKKKHD